MTAQVKTLTVGERQLIEIAKATATGAKVIIMDEPTASLNAEESKRLFRLIRQLKANGVGIIYISHRLAEVMELADRFTVLRDGQVMGTWQTGELSQKEIIQKMVGREVEIAERALQRRSRAAADCTRGEPAFLAGQTGGSFVLVEDGAKYWVSPDCAVPASKSLPTHSSGWNPVIREQYKSSGPRSESSRRSTRLNWESDMSPMTASGKACSPR